MPKSRIFNVAIMSFNAFRENKVLAKISEFTVISVMPVRNFNKISHFCAGNPTLYKLRSFK